MKIEKPGIYEIAEDAYHADPCKVPSLSASIAGKLVDRSPRHAREAHPRLNPNHTSDNKKEFDLGKAAHALLLEGDDGVVIIDADSYRTKDAKAQRDQAYAAGRTPILVDKWADVQAMAKAARQQFASIEGCHELFMSSFGQAEATLVWQEDDVWCRCRVDWLPKERGIIWDYKTTNGAAEPDSWARNNIFQGKDLQPAFYARGVRALLGWEEVEFRYVVQETEPPYALSVIALTPAAYAIADSRVDTALAMWRQCLAMGSTV